MLYRCGVLLAAVLTALAPAPAACHCRGLDRHALIQLYESLGGEGWKNNRNWNTTTGTSEENKNNDPCDMDKRWFGVGFSDPCDPYLDDILGSGPDSEYLTSVRGAGQGCFAGRITSLNLPRNSLVGNLSVPELGDLTNLTYLDLSWNEINGSIPPQIGKINNIQILQLSHNSISGELPTELGTLNSNGPTAELGCGIDDPCPEGSQMKMTDLKLRDNQIQGPIPSEIGDLVHLKIVDLSNNNMSGAVPPELGKLDELQVLYLRQNEISGTLAPSLFQNMSELRYLLMYENAISGSIPSQVGLLDQLNELDFHQNKLTGSLPTQLGEIGSNTMQRMQLQDNLLTGAIPDSIGDLRSLNHLDLYNNLMTGDIPASIQNLTNLKIMYVQNEHLTPVRNYYCRQRIPNVGKYNWRHVRDSYREMMAVVCDDPHDVQFTFNSLQSSSAEDAS